MTHDELKKAALQKPDVKAAYEALDPEFKRLRQTLKIHQDAEHTQTQVPEYVCRGETKALPIVKTKNHKS